MPYGHFGDGCVHVRIDFALRPTAGGGVPGVPARRARSRCATHGGSLSGEHGDGRARSELLPLMYDAESLRLFAAVKAICDPDGCSTRASWSTRRRSTPTCARRGAVAPVRTALRLVHDGGSLGNAVHRCTGVGKCLADNTGPAA